MSGAICPDDQHRWSQWSARPRPEAQYWRRTCPDCGAVQEIRPQVPPFDTAGLREALAEALHTKDGEDGSGRECPACTEDADALLPVVQRLAAEQVEAAGNALYLHREPITRASAMRFLHARADALAADIDRLADEYQARADWLAAAAQPTDGETA